MSTYDTIIVGAGPAGSSCAIKLGRSGLKVLLIDRAVFPRDKACGDAISPRLGPYLDHLGISKKLENLPHHKIQDIIFSHANVGNCYLRGALKRESEHGHMCKRIDFDNLLFQEAKKHVETIEDFKVSDLIFDKGRVCGVKGNDQELFAHLIVGADGANGVVAKKMGVAKFYENHNASAIRCYMEGVGDLSDSIELHFLDEIQPGYFWIFPLDKKTGLANVGLGLLSRELRKRKVEMKKVLHNVIETHPQFAPRFKHATMESKISGWSLPLGSKPRKNAFNHCLLIGDAASLIDPMSGEGIENAIKSAELAAETILMAKKIGDYSYHTLKDYSKKLKRCLGSELKMSYFLQKTARNPFGLKLLFYAMKYSKFSKRVIANKFF